MKIARLDFETFSEAPLEKCGVQVYAEDPSTDILCLGFMIDDVPYLWSPYIAESEVHLEKLFEAAKYPYYVFTAWNAAFEIAIWNEVCVKKYNFPRIPIEKWRCTMALAASFSLPLSLEKCGAAIGLPQDYQKDKRGKLLLSRLSKPQKVRRKNEYYRIHPQDAEQDFFDLCAYCEQDVVAEKAIHDMLPMQFLPPEEQEVWFIDQRINQRGIAADAVAAKRIVEMDVENRKYLNAQLSQITEGALYSGNQTAKLLEWCNERGCNLPSLEKPNIFQELSRDDLPTNVRSVLDLRLKISAKTSAKYHVILSKTRWNGRVCDNFQYHSAHTGRWGGRGLQLQNLSRPRIKDPEGAVNAILKGYTLDQMREEFGDWTDISISCIRAMLMCEFGYKLLVADYASIEARMLAWLAGQQSALKTFFAGGDIYVTEAAGIYGVPESSVDKDKRFIGKIAILSLGYNGGVGAFIGMGKNYGVDIDEALAKKVVYGWRNANKDIVKYWSKVERAAVSAVRNPDQKFTVGNDHRAIHFKMFRGYLVCKLPSGRLLWYPQAYLKLKETPWGEKKLQVHYRAQKDGKWVNISTYGGRLVENIVQAASRDLLAGGIMACEANGYPIVIHVHDEAGSEVPEDFGSLEEFERLLCTMPDWAKGLPLKSEGYVAERFRKD